MDTLNELINISIGIIAVGSVARAGISLIKAVFNYDEKTVYYKSAKNSIIATIVASSVFVIKAIVEHYFL